MLSDLFLVLPHSALHCLSKYVCDGVPVSVCECVCVCARAWQEGEQADPYREGADGRSEGEGSLHQAPASTRIPASARQIQLWGLAASLSPIIHSLPLVPASVLPLCCLVSISAPLSPMSPAPHRNSLRLKHPEWFQVPTETLALQRA